MILNQGVSWPEANSKLLYHLENKYDSSGNNKTLSNSGVVFVPGKFGQGAKLTATAYLYRSDAGAVDCDGNITIMFWFNFTTLPAAGVTNILFFVREWLGYWHYIKLSNAAGIYSLIYQKNYIEDGEASSVVNIAAGGWHHIAATFTASSRAMKLYLDGVKVATDTAGTSLEYIIYTSKLSIGNSSGGPSGVIDELAVHQEVKTDEWIKKYFEWATGQLG